MFPAAEKVSSLGKDWHKFCLKCERCNKTLTPGGHAEVRAAAADRGGAPFQGWPGGLSRALQHPRDRESQESWLGQVPDATRVGTQAQEHALWLQMLLLQLVVLKSSRTHVVPQLCHPNVGSQAACGRAWRAPAST